MPGAKMVRNWGGDAESLPTRISIFPDTELFQYFELGFIIMMNMKPNVLK